MNFGERKGKKEKETLAEKEPWKMQGAEPGSTFDAPVL